MNKSKRSIKNLTRIKRSNLTWCFRTSSNFSRRSVMPRYRSLAIFTWKEKKSEHFNFERKKKVLKKIQLFSRSFEWKPVRNKTISFPCRRRCCPEAAPRRASWTRPSQERWPTEQKLIPDDVGKSAKPEDTSSSEIEEEASSAEVLVP